jgi:mannose-6-phosphate isomerase-like protein (cupin superfamily)
MIRSTKNAEHYTWGDECEGWHLHQSNTLHVIEERMPSGTSERLHFHNNAQQVFYILSGTATFEINGEMVDVAARESLHIPKGTRHKIINNTAEDLVFLLISEPMAQNDRTDL